MNNTFFEFPVRRTLNTLLLAGILGTQVLILLHVREPIRVREPVDVEVTNEPSVEITNEPRVKITNDTEVWVANEPLQVQIIR